MYRSYDDSLVRIVYLCQLMLLRTHTGGWRAVERTPISRTYKLNPQTIVLQKYKQGGGRLSTLYTYFHKQLFIIKIISHQKVIIDS